MRCPSCHSYDPITRQDAQGVTVERCVEPAHAGFAETADETYREWFRDMRQAELDAARRSPKTKAISHVFWELTDAEYDAALDAVGLSR